MIPHERSLVKRLQGKPFALLGINSDEDLDQLRQGLKKEGITWPSWRNGGSPTGPISKKWNVNNWPTIYVLDHNGVIRYKDVREDQLDKAVDALLKVIASAKTEPKAKISAP
jgi:hypothetical protein